MFGSCGANTRCGIGEVTLNKVTILRTEKGVWYYDYYGVGLDRESSLELTSIKLLRNIGFSQSRDLSIIQYDRRASVSNTAEYFSPETINLQVKYLEDIERAKRFMRDKNSTYIARFEFSNKTVFCEVILQSDTVETYTILQTWSLSLLRTSMFFTPKNVVMTNTPGTNVWRASLINSGDTRGAIRFNLVPTLQFVDPITIKFYSTQEPKPQIQPFNMFSIPYNVFVPGNDEKLEYSSVPGDMYIIRRLGSGSAEDVSGFRDFSTKGYVDTPHGEYILEIANVDPFSGTAAEVTVYEYYYNI